MDFNEIDKRVEADLRRFRTYNRTQNEDNLRRWVMDANLMYLTKGED